jgi:hypothetical protein
VPSKTHLVLVCLGLSLAAALTAGAEPGVELADTGRTIVYRARPGDTPTGIARALGVPEAQIDAFLRAKGVTGASRVPVGFEYRVPNPLVARAEGAEQRIVELERQAAAADAHAVTVEERLAAVQRSEELRLEQRLRLAQLEGRWRLALWAIVWLSVALAVAGAVAAIARRRERGAARFVRTMAQELEDKRRSGLAERQRNARRIVELEDRLGQLEGQLGDRARSLSRSA